MWIIAYVLKTSKMSRIQYMDVYFRFHMVGGVSRGVSDTCCHVSPWVTTSLHVPVFLYTCSL